MRWFKGWFAPDPDEQPRYPELVYDIAERVWPKAGAISVFFWVLVGADYFFEWGRSDNIALAALIVIVAGWYYVRSEYKRRANELDQQQSKPPPLNRSRWYIKNRYRIALLTLFNLWVLFQISFFNWTGNQWIAAFLALPPAAFIWLPLSRWWERYTEKKLLEDDLR